jgi:hypothetical protein
VTMPIRQAWLESFAVDLDEVKNASRELNLKVQIVSRAPDQLGLIGSGRRGHCGASGRSGRTVRGAEQVAAGRRHQRTGGGAGAACAGRYTGRGRAAALELVGRSLDSAVARFLGRELSL